jgi:nuclear pore complex protein Nup88
MAAGLNWCEKLRCSPLFNVLRENSSKLKPADESKSLLTINDGDLFVWDTYGSALLTLSLKNLLPTSLSDEDGHRQPQPFQTITCTDTPVFEVHSIACNQTGTHIFVAGRHGIAVISLPQRRGRFGEFDAGSQQILSRSVKVNERFFVTSEFVLLHAAWHPGSPTSTHLVTLTSDNVIRIYDISISIENPEATYHLAQLVSGVASRSSPSRQAIVLGDTFVSFDIGAPLDHSPSPDANQASETIEAVPRRGRLWPIYMLLGNGEVFRLLTSLDTKSPPVRQLLVGPLRMYPAAEDNYGVEACSILSLGTHPTVLVVGTSEGKLHHCLLLNQPLDEEDNETDSLSSSLYQPIPVPALFVYETVELELSLTTIAIETDELLNDYFSCPIRLLRDPASNERYHCAHGAGLHSLVLPWAQKLQQFCDAANATDTMPLSAGQHSIVEHLICTKPLRSSPISPVLGVCVVSDRLLGTKIICLTSTLECVTLPLMPTYSVELLPLMSDADVDSFKSPLRQMYKEPFDARIRKILQRNSSNPILKGSTSAEPTAAECLKLMFRATQVFREEYIQKLEQARDEISRRIKVLQTLKTQQQTKLEQFDVDRCHLLSDIEQLKEKYEETKRRQQMILTRTESVLRRLQQRAPVLSEAEKGTLKELRDIEALLRSYTSRIKTISSKMRYQTDTIKAPSSPYGLRSTPATKQSTITSRQSQNIQSLLQKEGNDIADLVQQVKSMQMNLVS